MNKQQQFKLANADHNGDKKRQGVERVSKRRERHDISIEKANAFQTCTD